MWTYLVSRCRAKGEGTVQVGANRDTGEGGDDGYDCLRYAMASRPPPARLPPDDKPFDAWSREALKAEMDAHRKSKRRLGGDDLVPWTGI